MRILYCFILLSLTESCRTVSTEHRKVVSQFALKTENFSGFPEKLWTEIAEIREARGVYYASSFTDPASHLKELDAIVRERMADDQIPGRIGSVFKILDHYAGGLVELSSDELFRTGSQLFGSFGDDLDDLVKEYNNIDKDSKLPAGVGSVLAKTLDEGTKAFIANRQYKVLRKYVNQADTLVSALCSEMVNYLNSGMLIQLIKNEESGIRESFGFYFSKRSPPDINSGNAYITLMKRNENLNALRMQTIRAAGNLKIAHHKVAETLGKGRTFKETTADLNRFYMDVKSLNTMVKKLDW